MVSKKVLPEWGELVSCRVKRITPFAAWCEIEGYQNIEGMIHISEVAGKWVRNIRDFVKLDKEYIAKVVKVDYQKNHVNLSLKRVSKFDKKERVESLRREKRGEKMFEQATKQLRKTIEQAYEELGFDLQKQFGDFFTAFEEMRDNPDLLEEVPKEWVGALKNVIEANFKKKEVTLKAELELISYAKDGVEKIKELLAELEKSGATVKYISAPKYRAEIKTTNPKEDVKKLKGTLENIMKELKKFECEGSYKLIK